MYAYVVIAAILGEIYILYTTSCYGWGLSSLPSGSIHFFTSI